MMEYRQQFLFYCTRATINVPDVQYQPNMIKLHQELITLQLPNRNGQNADSNFYFIASYK